MVDPRLVVAAVAVAVSSCGVINGVTTGGVRSPFAPVLVPLPGEGGRCDGGDVQLITDDGQGLGALWSPSGTQGPGIVLVHQTSGDGTNWGPETFNFFESLGYSVLSFDRRVQERDGPDAFRDVAAAVAFLNECNTPTFALVGASTGTTALFDYILEDGDAGLGALVFLSPGPWTASNHQPYVDHVSELSLFFGFTAVTQPADCCGAEQLDPVPATWTAQSYTGNATDFHAEKMLEGVPGLPLRRDLTTFLTERLPP